MATETEIVQLQFRQGLKADLVASALIPGEPVYSTDTKEIGVALIDGTIMWMATLNASGKLNQMPAAADVGAVPITRKVNSKELSSDISLTASDVGALPSTANVQLDMLSSAWSKFAALNTAISIPLTYPTGLTANNYAVFIYRVGNGAESSMQMMTKLNASAIQSCFHHEVMSNYWLNGNATISGNTMQATLRELAGWAASEVFIGAVFGLRVS